MEFTVNFNVKIFLMDKTPGLKIKIEAFSS